MIKKDKEFFIDLLAAPSPSGYELPASLLWRKYVSQFAEKVYSDYHGNSIAAVNIKGKQRLLFTGHIDELGFIVNFISDKGFIYFRPIGGHDRGIISGRGVLIYTSKGPVAGVTGKKAIHMMTPDERKKVPEVEDIWIDIGAASREDAKKVVSVGDPVVYDVQFNSITDKIVTSRAFDDKAGAFAIALALKLIKGKRIVPAVYAVATVQEEIGIRGAHTSAYGIDPHVGIAVDVTHATDHPDVDTRKEGEVKLGNGPVILRGANANPVLSRMLIEIAKKNKIPYQLEAYGGGTGTDANAIQLTRKGVATALVSIPLRYMHTPREVIHLDDVENCAKLLAEFALCYKDASDYLL